MRYEFRNRGVDAAAAAAGAGWSGVCFRDWVGGGGRLGGGGRFGGRVSYETGDDVLFKVARAAAWAARAAVAPIVSLRAGAVYIIAGITAAGVTQNWNVSAVAVAAVVAAVGTVASTLSSI